MATSSFVAQFQRRGVHLFFLRHALERPAFCAHFKQDGSSICSDTSRGVWCFSSCSWRFLLRFRVGLGNQVIVRVLFAIVSIKTGRLMTDMLCSSFSVGRQ